MSIEKEIFTITKVVTTETAHRLYPYAGKCKFIHGHSYKFEVSITGETSNSMLLDFKDLKDMINNVIVSLVDHCLVLWVDDPLYKFLSVDYWDEIRIIPWEEMPTAESFAKVFCKVIVENFRVGEILKVSVDVWETETSKASYSINIPDVNRV